MRIKSGDTIEVISGNDKGMRGTVRVVYPRRNRIVVEGVRIVTKHQRAIPAGRQQTPGGRIEFEAPINASNVMLVCPSCQERTRVEYAFEGDRKVRVCKKCDAHFE